MTSLDRLISTYAGPALCRQFPISDTAGVQDPDWMLVLKALTLKNGFYAFESSLHVFHLGELRNAFDLVEWNTPNLWKSAYKHSDLSDVLCFAENIFGEQFCIKEGQFVRIDPETAEVELIAETLEGWACAILDEPDLHLGYTLGRSWQSINGPLKASKRLVPKVPFVCGGAFEVENLVEMDAVEAMRFRGHLATQLHDAPDGAILRFEITENPK